MTQIPSSMLFYFLWKKLSAVERLSRSNAITAKWFTQVCNKAIFYKPISYTDNEKGLNAEENIPGGGKKFRSQNQGKRTLHYTLIFNDTLCFNCANGRLRKNYTDGFDQKESTLAKPYWFRFKRSDDFLITSPQRRKISSSHCSWKHWAASTLNLSGC